MPSAMTARSTVNEEKRALSPEQTSEYPNDAITHPAPGSHDGTGRSITVNKLKQGMAAIGLVASLGLIVPSTFGGSASADVSHNPHLNQYNDPFPLSCDLDGNST